MSTLWRSVENKCEVCQEPIIKTYVKGGKILVEKYLQNWGCWRKVSQKSEMHVMCCYCQKKMVKEENRRKRAEMRKQETTENTTKQT